MKFHIDMQQVVQMIVNSRLELWEINVIKGILSQMQITTQEQFKPVYKVREVSYTVFKIY